MSAIKPAAAVIDHKTGVARRLTRGLSANGVLQLVVLFNRLAEVPLFLAFWGAAGYGKWLMIAALPSALALSDGGFTKSAQREMAMRAARGDQQGMLRAFQCAWVLLSVFSIAMLAILALVLPALPLDRWLAIDQPNRHTTAITLLLLSGQVLISFQTALLTGGFNSAGAYAEGTLFTAITYLLDFLGVALAIFLGGGMIEAAAGSLTGRVSGFLLARIWLRRRLPMLKYGYAHSSVGEIKVLFLPSLANMVIPVGDALNTQAIRLLVGTVLGPAALSNFSALRTLCRMSLQPVYMIARTIEPEMSFAYGASNSARVRQLLVHGTHSTIWFSLTLCILLAILGPVMFHRWTGGRLVFIWPTFLLLLGASLVNSVWCVAYTVANATNRHLRLSIYYTLINGFACIIVGYPLTRFLHINGAALSVLFCEAALAFVVVKVAMRLAHQPWLPWISTVSRPPFDLLRKALGALFQGKNKIGKI